MTIYRVNFDIARFDKASATVEADSHAHAQRIVREWSRNGKLNVPEGWTFWMIDDSQEVKE